ncbi:uncharacterized protein SAPINGB_P003819 [Magnusiomyces paraingens]|uniref:Mitochondrial carrier protein n=1 Tax=Magnusiomyces paraingens TaxID=2606893 RepID=A0A5E8BYQ8_9ASCO|nr:uncharacterized protein SAPINGB_P003819 [Saprochaete ingens]VVT53925.1 unnamed protein product [Saprochaete ingens]
MATSPLSTLAPKDRFYAHLTDSQINAAAGAVAGVFSALAVCPLDVAKTKLQAQGGMLSLQKHYAGTPPESASLSPQNTPNAQTPIPQRHLSATSVAAKAAAKAATATTAPKATYPAPYVPKYHGILGTLSTIVREEGVAGLYRGVVPITIGYLPTWAIYFVVYEDVKKLTEKPLANYPFFAHMVSALSAGSSSTLVTNPIWVVKTRLMTQSKGHNKYKGTIDTFHKMFMEEGILSFYAGLGPALLGLLHVMVHFPLYEELKKVFHVDDNVPKLHQAPQILCASVISKICASTLTYPHEVIRTRVQIQPTIIEESGAPGCSSSSDSGKFMKKRNTSLMKYHGIIQTTKTIWREEGWRAFYSGLGINMFRTVPASALTLLTYEVVASYLKDKRNHIIRSL